MMLPYPCELRFQPKAHEQERRAASGEESSFDSPAFLQSIA